MNTISKALAKGTIATVAAGAMAMASAAPAQAQYRDRHRDRSDIDVGDVIAGALIIGGIAAVASAAGRGGYDYRGGYNYRDRDYRGGDYRNSRWGDYRDRDYRGSRQGYDARSAVEQCVYAAEQNANRYSYGGRSKVTDIRKVDTQRDGYEISGRIAVNASNRDWRSGDSRYGRGWDNDYRGWNEQYRGYDSGRFTCEVRYGRVVDIDYSGIRGL